MSADARPDPERLLAQARAGNGDCLGALLELYRNYLYLMARTQIDLHLQGRASASDAVQEAFVQACANFGHFRGDSEQELLAWLRRILVNTLAGLIEKQMKARKRDVRREVSVERLVRNLENSSAAFEAALVSPHSSPSARAERRELAAPPGQPDSDSSATCDAAPATCGTWSDSLALTPPIASVPNKSRTCGQAECILIRGCRTFFGVPDE